MQPGRERLGLHLEGGAHAREEPRIDAESDPSPAPRSEDALGGERHGPRQRHVGAPVHLRDGKTGDLVEARDHLLHPEVAQDEGLEIEGRAQEGEEALAVDVHGQRLLPDYLGLDFLEAAALELEVRPHRPYRATPVRKTKGPRPGALSKSTRFGVRPARGSGATCEAQPKASRANPQKIGGRSPPDPVKRSP